MHVLTKYVIDLFGDHFVVKHGAVASYWLVKGGDHTSEAALHLALILMRGWSAPSLYCSYALLTLMTKYYLLVNAFNKYAIQESAYVMTAYLDIVEEKNISNGLNRNRL